MKIYLQLIILSLLFCSCVETRTSDVNEAYLYWSGVKPTADLHVERAQYWQSPSFSKEYILYMKLKPHDEWWEQFIKQNELELKTDSWTNTEDTPTWFKPSEHCIQYGTKDHFDQGSRYFRDTLTGACFMYEIQL